MCEGTRELAVLCPALTCVLCYAILFQRGCYGVFVFMHRGMCEALFGVPVFCPGCEICCVMFALRWAIVLPVAFRVDEVLRYCSATSWGVFSVLSGLCWFSAL